MDAGAAVMLLQPDLTPERLLAELTSLLLDRERLAAMGAKPNPRPARRAGAHRRDAMVLALASGSSGSEITKPRRAGGVSPSHLRNVLPVTAAAAAVRATTAPTPAVEAPPPPAGAPPPWKPPPDERRR